MPITVRDLQQRPDPHAFLLCSRCGAESSANAGDYFLVPPDHIFTCCDIPMIRVRRITRDEEV